MQQWGDLMATQPHELADLERQRQDIDKLMAGLREWRDLLQRSKLMIEELTDPHSCNWTGCRVVLLRRDLAAALATGPR